MISEEDKLPPLQQFLTGTDEVPAIGFDAQGTVTFYHEGVTDDIYTKNYPKVNTCSLSIRLPLLANYNEFKTNFDAAQEYMGFTTE